MSGKAKMTETNENPLETLVDLFVYAPIGLLYEHEDVLPRLVKRGRSQVQLARVVGQMAIRQNVAGKGGPTAQIGQLQVPIDALAAVAAQFITDIGSAIGLAPPKSTGSAGDTEADASARPATPSRRVETPKKSDGDSADSSQTTVEVAEHPEPVAPHHIDRLPIARYDELTARDIIALLDDLTVSQLARVENYEKANRARKTVLAKITRIRDEDR
jgi:hypothetical protein